MIQDMKALMQWFQTRDVYTIARVKIVYYNVRRPLERIADSGTAIRPWLQDFPDYAYDGRVYTSSETRAHMRGARLPGAVGWMLWDRRVRNTPRAL